MKTLYGDVSLEQVEGHIQKLHNAMFWLLLYKDPKTRDSFKDVDFEYYFVTLMGKINGLNRLLMERSELVTVMSYLEAAYLETQKNPFDYRLYRKYVLDAHGELDRLGEEAV